MITFDDMFLPLEIICPKCAWPKAYRHFVTVVEGDVDPGYVRCSECNEIYTPPLEQQK